MNIEESIFKSYKKLFNKELETKQVILAHDNSDDPKVFYANDNALKLWEMDLKEILGMPSRLTAEAPEREARAKFLEEVQRKGFIENYSGIRVSKTGKRFLIKEACVWNLLDSQGIKIGQAACFNSWEEL